MLTGVPTGDPDRLNPLPAHADPTNVKSARDESLEGTLSEVKVALCTAYTAVGDLGGSMRAGCQSRKRVGCLRHA